MNCLYDRSYVEVKNQKYNQHPTEDIILRGGKETNF